MTAGLKFLRTSGKGGVDPFFYANGAESTVQTLRRYLLVRAKINRFGLDRKKKRKKGKKKPLV